MGFRELEKEFKKEVSKDSVFWDEKDDFKTPNYKEASERTYRYWLLRLLFEIAGNLDSLVVSHRNSEKHVDRMATAYVELVKMNKERNK